MYLKIIIYYGKTKKNHTYVENSKEMMALNNLRNKLSESQLIEVKDNLYEDSRKGVANFKGLIELIVEEENLIDAIRKIKANKGFNTEGTDNVIGQEILNKPIEYLDSLKSRILNYESSPIRLIDIPKSNGQVRTLGVSTIEDRIIQTAITNIIEPILEPKMYKHSYGSRPMRSIENVIGYMNALTVYNKRHWIVEGDIKSYFDEINHNILISKLYKYGIRDKRLLMIIKKIIKAERPNRNIGLPQGGILSPLLANVYLTDFDKWVEKQWVGFKTNRKYATNSGRKRHLRNSNLKEGFLIRYVDDWVIMTDTEENAIKWKNACNNYLKKELKLTLNVDKTKITNLTKSRITFLGYEFYKIKGRKGNYTLRTGLSKETMQDIQKVLVNQLKLIRKSYRVDANLVVKELLLYNSMIRGYNNFYKHGTSSQHKLSIIWEFIDDSRMATYKRLNMIMINNNATVNLKDSKRIRQVMAYKVKQKSTYYLGLERLGYKKFVSPKIKAQWGHPYSQRGRDLYTRIHGKAYSTIPRNVGLMFKDIDKALRAKNKFYNLEYYINRPMAFNRDKCQCRNCDKTLTGFGDTDIHHKNSNLGIDEINKVINLITLCKECHIIIHKEVSNKSIEKPKKKTVKGKSKVTTRPSQPSKIPPKEILIDEIKTYNYTQLGKQYEVSANTIKKWAIKYNIHELRIVKRPRKTIIK